jgi:pullulanase/glycogen debranching enzyme
MTWLDWERITPEGRSLLEFTRKLIAVRKAYQIPSPALSLADATRLDVKM